MAKLCYIDSPFKVKDLVISKDTMMLMAIGHDGNVCYWKLQDQSSSIRLNLEALKISSAMISPSKEYMVIVD